MGRNASEDPVRFSRDKPKECKFCYFWQPRQKSCELGEKNCFYIIKEEPPPEPTRCDGCPYGRTAPCVGWCTVDVLEEVSAKRKQDKAGEEVGKCQSSA